jgi:membrane fusion protein, heavy metal efflux system
MSKDSAYPHDATEHSEVGKTPGEENTDKTLVTRYSRSSKRNLVIITSVTLVAIVVIVIALISRNEKTNESKLSVTAEHGEETKEEAGDEVELPPDDLAKIEVVGVTQRPAVSLLKVTGAVEANQQQQQQVTPLISGRVERVFVALGDRVRAGSVLATISSPQIAQLHGKLHEAETRLGLAERNLARVQKAENRVSVLSAKAKLDEAEATLRRTKRLIELGVGAGKDLVAAEAQYKTAKAEYDFQSNIALNRELQEAKAEVETSRVDVAHIRDELSALGAPAAPGKHDNHRDNTALVTVRAPMSGVITERLVNPGAGIDAGKPLFTISNLSSVWVIANVPESQIGSLRVGTPAEIRSAALGGSALSGRVSYIDPQLDEGTRTARVRIEVPNRNEQLKAGMFVEVGFQAGTGGAGGEELVIPNEAVHRIGDRTVVFIPEEDEPGHYKVRDVELGGEVNGYRRVLSGLELEDKVVAKGGFVLKSKLLKSQFGEEEEEGH